MPEERKEKYRQSKKDFGIETKKHGRQEHCGKTDYGLHHGNRSADGLSADRFAEKNHGRNNKTAGNVRSESPRMAALRSIQDVFHQDAYASQALDRQLENCRLKEEDRRLAASLFYHSIENRLYLEVVLAPYISSKPEPIIQDILILAAAQLVLMDRIPDHAAVDEAVKQVRYFRREGYTGMVNAVLRALIRDRDAQRLALPDREAEPDKWLSVRYSVAPCVVQRLVSAYGFEIAERICAYTPKKHDVTIRPNLMRMDAAAFEKYLTGKGLSWTCGIVPDAYCIEGAGALARDEGYRRGDYSIQGQSAMLTAWAVGASAGMRILDACAAPGGKTCMMAEQMTGSGRVYAWDIHEHRVDLIRAAVRRLGLDNVRPSVHDAAKPIDDMRLSMDAVLVDAPCSGLGVISDKPDIKYRLTAQTLDELPGVQAKILENCAEAVRPGGLLVYATCTLLPQENDNIVDGFLKGHPEFLPDNDASWLPEKLRPAFENGRLQLLPFRDGIEGFFIARMRRAN